MSCQAVGIVQATSWTHITTTCERQMPQFQGNQGAQNSDRTCDLIDGNGSLGADREGPGDGQTKDEPCWG